MLCWTATWLSTHVNVMPVVECVVSSTGLSVNKAVLHQVGLCSMHRDLHTASTSSVILFQYVALHLHNHMQLDFAAVTMRFVGGMKKSCNIATSVANLNMQTLAQKGPQTTCSQQWQVLVRTLPLCGKWGRGSPFPASLQTSAPLCNPCTKDSTLLHPPTSYTHMQGHSNNNKFAFQLMTS